MSLRRGEDKQGRLDLSSLVLRGYFESRYLLYFVVHIMLIISLIKRIGEGLSSLSLPFFRSLKYKSSY